LQCQDLDAGTLTWMNLSAEYQNGSKPPGDYTFTYAVTVNSVVTESFTLKKVLTDPCTSAALSGNITKPTIQTYSYYITDDTESELLTPKFTTDPAWCASSLTFSAPSDLDNFAAFDKPTQVVSYTEITDSLTLSGLVDPSNTELSKTYQVTLTYTTTDYAGTTSDTIVVYDIIIKNPCINQDYVTIEA